MRNAPAGRLVFTRNLQIRFTEKKRKQTREANAVYRQGQTVKSRIAVRKAALSLANGCKTMIRYIKSKTERPAGSARRAVEPEKERVS